LSSKASKLVSTLRLIVYLIVIVGAALYLYGLYESRGEWRYEIGGAPRVSFVSPTVVSIEVPLRIYNPAGDVSAKLVYYQVYLNNVRVGDGLIPYLTLPHGWSNRTFKVTVDILDLGCGGVDALLKGKATVKVSGYAMVDIKTFGGLTWKTITVPFNTTAREARVPPVPEESKPALEAIAAMCKLAHSTPGFNIPFPTGSETGAGQGGTSGSTSSGEGNVTVYLDFRPAGFGRYSVVVVVENNLDETVRAYRIVVHTVSGETARSVDLTIPPGGRVSYDTGVTAPIASTVTVEVYTDHGPYTGEGRVG